MAPKLVSASEANRSFSKLLERVKRGETIDITSHGRVVAEMRPKDNRDEEERRASLLAHLDELAKRPFTVIGPWTRAELYEDD